jgi:chromosome condensin MukBEF complex kleisin-like MukF subunit
MASEGLITSEVLKGALIDANEQLNESFEKSSVTIGQAMTIATNDFIKKFGEMDEVY